MGKQVNFYMRPEDEKAFLDDANEVAALSVLAYMSPAEEFEPLLVLPERSQPGWFQLWLWSEDKCQRPLVRWVWQQECYVIDGVDSDIIEFSRSHQSENSIVRGRLWAEIKTRDLKPKSTLFVDWFDSLVKLIKKRYRKLPNGEYVGPAAEKFVAEGGTLRQMLSAPVVKVVSH